MRITGTADLQRTLPAAEIAALQNACGQIGFEHDDITLHVESAGRGDKSASGIQINSYGDKDIVLSIKGAGSEKSLLCSLTWKKDKAGADVQIALFRALKAAPKAKNDAASKIPLILKVSGLKDKDRAYFPVKQQAALEKVLAEAEIIEEVVLQFVSTLRGDPEEIGIRIGDSNGKGVGITLQDYERSARAQCILSMRTGSADQDGKWLKTLLRSLLEPETESDEDAEEEEQEAPAAVKAEVLPPPTEASADEGGDDDEEDDVHEEAPPPAKAVLPVREVSTAIVKVPALGFTGKLKA